MPKFIAAVLLAGAAAASFAQPSGEGRGSIPPGESRDESRPADGAIKGGSIEKDIGASQKPEREIARCKELTGELQEQCLRDLGAGAGGSQPGSPGQADPAAPPPQNPPQPR